CADELRALAESGPTAQEIDRARAVLNAGLWMSDENPAARAGRAAAQTLLFGAPIPSQLTADRTLAQTRDSVRAAAATALAGGVAASAVLGPRAASSAGPAFHAALFG
ncbi:MAG: insulinase family protein, partial [Alphaproteobacteria bacterium]